LGTTGLEDPPAASVGAEATLADGDAAAFWWEFRRALLPRLGWSVTVSEPTVSLAWGTSTGPNRPAGT